MYWLFRFITARFFEVAQNLCWPVSAFWIAPFLPNLIFPGPLAEIVVLTSLLFFRGFSWTGRFVNGIWYPFTIDKTSWWRIILFYCFTNWDSLPASGTFGISSVNNFLSTGCIKVIDASGTSFELLVKGTYFRFSEEVFTLWF